MDLAPIVTVLIRDRPSSSASILVKEQRFVFKVDLEKEQTEPGEQLGAAAAFQEGSDTVDSSLERSAYRPFYFLPKKLIAVFATWDDIAPVSNDSSIRQADGTIVKVKATQDPIGYDMLLRKARMDAGA